MTCDERPSVGPGVTLDQSYDLVICVLFLVLICIFQIYLEPLRLIMTTLAALPATNTVTVGVFAVVVLFISCLNISCNGKTPFRIIVRL